MAAARFSEYAIATACLSGFPALTSALMLLSKAFLLVDFFSGMSFRPFVKTLNLGTSPNSKAPDSSHWANHRAES